MQSGEVVTREIASDESPSVAVAEAVADYLDTEPTDVPPLFDVVDGEALDSVVQAPDSELRFRYQDLDVRVIGTSRVEIE